MTWLSFGLNFALRLPDRMIGQIRELLCRSAASRSFPRLVSGAPRSLSDLCGSSPLTPVLGLSGIVL